MQNLNWDSTSAYKVVPFFFFSPSSPLHQKTTCSRWWRGGEQAERGGEQADWAGHGDPLHVTAGREGQWNGWEFSVLTSGGLTRCVNPEDWQTALLCRWGGASNCPAAKGNRWQAQWGSKKSLPFPAKRINDDLLLILCFPFSYPDAEQDERASWALWKLLLLQQADEDLPDPNWTLESSARRPRTACLAQNPDCCDLWGELFNTLFIGSEKSNSGGFSKIALLKRTLTKLWIIKLDF